MFLWIEKLIKVYWTTFYNMRHIVYHNPPSYLSHFFFGNIYVNYIPRHASRQKKLEDEPCRHCLWSFWGYYNTPVKQYILNTVQIWKSKSLFPCIMTIWCIHRTYYCNYQNISINNFECSIIESTQVTVKAHGTLSL